MIDSSSQLCCRVCVPPRQTACFMKWGNQWRQTAYLLWSCRHAEATSLSQRSTVRYVSRWMRRHSNNKKRGSRADQSSCGRQLAERRKHSLRAAVRSCSKYVCAMFCKLRETTSSDIPPVSCCLRAVCLSLALSDCLRWPRHSSLPLSLALSLSLSLSLSLYLSVSLGFFGSCPPTEESNWGEGEWGGGGAEYERERERERESGREIEKREQLF